VVRVSQKISGKSGGNLVATIKNASKIRQNGGKMLRHPWEKVAIEFEV